MSEANQVNKWVDQAYMEIMVVAPLSASQYGKHEDLVSPNPR